MKALPGTWYKEDSDCPTHGIERTLYVLCIPGIPGIPALGTGYFLSPELRVIEERSDLRKRQMQQYVVHTGMYQNQQSAYPAHQAESACGFGEDFWLSLA